MKIPDILKERIDYYSKSLEKHPKLCKLYKNCCPNTIETALEECEDGTYFVLTGDIPAMWLRDSTAQVYSACRGRRNKKNSRGRYKAAAYVYRNRPICQCF